MPTKKKKPNPDTCEHTAEQVDWWHVPEVHENGLRYVGKCDCGAEVAEDYTPTGKIYEI